MDKKVGVLGAGPVGKTLANGFRDLGYEVKIGNRSGSPVEGWTGPAETLETVARDSDILILAVKGIAAEKVVIDIKDHLSGKIVIDTTNPIAEKPAENGVLSYFTTLEQSLMERLQLAVPEAHFIKAFNSVGSAYMIHPSFEDLRPTMFICGDDEAAKKDVQDMLDRLGWDVEDMGSVTSARAIEPLCMLWCLPGLLHNQWSHAFKLLKA